MKLARLLSMADKQTLRRVMLLVRKKLGKSVDSGMEFLRIRRSRITIENKLSAAPLRVAIIGCGVMGAQIAAAAKMLPNAQVFALCDLDAGATDRVRRKYWPQAAVHADTESLFSAFAGPDDVLVIATTANSHVPLALAALERGIKRILLEKPVGTSLASCTQLMEAARRHSATIAIDHTRRWSHVFQGAKRLLASGMIGDLLSIDMVFGRAGFAMIGTHLFDVARWFTGSEIARASGQLDARSAADRRGSRFDDPGGRCTLDMASGHRVRIDLSEAMVLRQDLITLHGSRGRIVIDQRLQQVSVLAQSGKIWERSYSSARANALAVATALQELHAGREPACSLQDGYAALEAAVAVTLSSRGGGDWIEMPLVGEIVQESFAYA